VTALLLAIAPAASGLRQGRRVVPLNVFLRHPGDKTTPADGATAPCILSRPGYWADRGRDDGDVFVVVRVRVVAIVGVGVGVGRRGEGIEVAKAKVVLLVFDRGYRWLRSLAQVVIEIILG
jgi:hypothetical protein